MAFDILNALELDKDPLAGKVILIKEASGGEADFFFGCFMSKQIKADGGVCLVTVQHHFDHYHAVGMKMGFNLKAPKEPSRICHIDYLKEYADRLAHDPDELYKKIETGVSERLGACDSACIIIDDVTQLLHAFTLSDANRLVQKCRRLAEEKGNCCLIVGAHVISTDDQSHTLSQLISHSADLICEVAPLKSGRSAEVSGTFRIIRPWLDEGGATESRFTKLNEYLYKTFDRGIKVFAPGLR